MIRRGMTIDFDLVAAHKRLSQMSDDLTALFEEYDTCDTVGGRDFQAVVNPMVNFGALIAAAGTIVDEAQHRLEEVRSDLPDLVNAA